MVNGIVSSDPVVRSKSDALKRMGTLARPSKREENYRYSGLRELDPMITGLVAGAAPTERLPEGVKVFELTQALSERSASDRLELLARVQGPSVFESDWFAQATLAQAPKTWVVEISPEMKIQTPVVWKHLIPPGAQGVAERVMVFVGQNAELTWLNEWGVENSGGEAVHLALFELIAAQGAQVRVIEQQCHSMKTQAAQRSYYELGAHANVHFVSASTGCQRLQHRMEVKCLGAGAHFEYSGATRVGGEQIHDLWLTVHHLVPRTSSVSEQWSVAGAQAKTVFNGTIVIPEGSVKTDALQKNYNLLLSHQAVIDTLPKLEISCDDVKCAHGASVSPVSVDQVYYLQSRGIEQSQAERMIIDGFTSPVLAKIKDHGLRARVARVLGGEDEESAL